MAEKTSVDISAKALLERAHSLKNNAETQALYRDWANTYDETMLDGLGYLSPAKAAKLLTHHLSDKSAAILDVGTGTGLVGAELAQLGYLKIDGIDYSAAMLEKARARDIYRQLIEADLNEPLNIERENYDALICIGTFTHGHVGADCLDELFRIIKPGGHFVTAIRKNYWQPAGFAQKIAQLGDEGIVKTTLRVEDSNYQTSSEAESWFFVWQKI